MKRLLFARGLALLVSVVGFGPQAVRAADSFNDGHTLLCLSFDGTLNGASGESPVIVSNVWFTQGILGSAAYFPTGNYLGFISTNNIRAEEGTLEFWIRPEWRGDDASNHCVLAWGEANGASFTKDGANNLRSLFNRWNVVAPEVGVVQWVGDWMPFQWRHVAFTWKSTFPSKQTICRLYVDGRHRSTSVAPYVIYPPTTGEIRLRIGGEFGDGNLQATLDELRISDIERTDAEIQESYLRGIVRTVGIDIRPGSDPNSVNLYSKGKLPVAVLGSAEFDATRVDPLTVRFGRYGTEAVPDRWEFEDANGDGLVDAVLHFPTQDTGLCCGDVLGQVTGKLVGGSRFRGRDGLNLVRCPPYTLKVQGMQDVRQVTDVYLTVTLVSNLVAAGYAPPSMADHVQLKTFDLEGDLCWTRNERVVPMDRISRESSLAHLAYDDLGRHQPIDARLQVPHPTDRNTEIVRGQGRVLLRPDLEVGEVSYPPVVFTYQTVPLAGFIRELNGDLAATTTVLLRRGDQIWDRIGRIWVGVHSNAAAVFSLRFKDPGRYEFVLEATNVEPGDYDLSNNAKAFTLEVIDPPLQTVSYSANYNHSSYVYSNRYEYAWGGGSTMESGRRERTFLSLFMPDVALKYPLGRVLATYAADGAIRETYELQDVKETWWEYQPDYRRIGTWQVLGDNVYFRAESFEQYGGSRWSSASLEKYAVDTVYFSEQHSKDWGNYSWSQTNRYGIFLGAVDHLGIQLIVQGPAGKFGGWAWIDRLLQWPFDDAWNWSSPEGWFEIGFRRGVETWGDASGVTEP